MASGEEQGIIEKKNVSDLVTCPLCLEYFQNPKLLPCGHSVCRDCLQIYVDKTLDQLAFLCPMCRSSITLSNDGVDGLTHSFLIVRLQDEYNKVQLKRSCDACNHDGATSLAKSKCVECSEYLCEECAKTHRKFSFSRNHHIVPLGQNVVADKETEKMCNMTSIKCHNHQDEIVRYFCLPCRMLICRDCKALDHTNHKAVTFEEAIKGKRDDLRSDVLALQSKQRELLTVVEHISRNIQTLGREKTTLTDSINEERGKLISVINQAADNVIDDAEIAISNVVKTHQNELEGARFLLAQMESHMSYTHVLLSEGSDVEVLHDYNLVKGRSTNLTSETVSAPDYQIPTLQSTLGSSITNELKNHFVLRCRDDSSTELHDPSEKSVSKITGRRLESLALLQTIPPPSGGKISSVAFHDNTVFACDGGKLYRFKGNTWTDISNSYNTKARANGVCVSNNTMVASTCMIGGDQKVTLIVSDLTTTGHTIVTLPISSGHPSIVFGRPVDGQPTYFVTQRSENCVVHRIDCKGNMLQTYGKGELKRPLGVAIDVQGDVVVADYALNDVIIYDHDGSVKRRLRQHNNLSRERMAWPWDVCVDQDGYIYVSSYATNSVLLFSSSGDYTRTVLTQKDGIYHPTFMSVSQDGRLAVCAGSGIKVYTYMDSA